MIRAIQTEQAEAGATVYSPSIFVHVALCQGDKLCET